MELQNARHIIDTLAQGIHPVTGEAMPDDSPYNAPPVIRALFAVSHALQEARPRKPPRALPPNAGKPWSAEEDGCLRESFARGTQVPELAQQLGRSRWAVESRLVKLGQLAGRGTVPFPEPAG